MQIDITRTLIIIAICVGITWFERAVPFILFRKGNVPGYVKYLGKVLAAAIMTTLFFYCIRGVSFESAEGYAPQLISCIVTIGLHLMLKKTMISIVGGTICCMLLTQLVF